MTMTMEDILAGLVSQGFVQDASAVVNVYVFHTTEGDYSTEYDVVEVVLVFEDGTQDRVVLSPSQYDQLAG